MCTLAIGVLIAVLWLCVHAYIRFDMQCVQYITRFLYHLLAAGHLMWVVVFHPQIRDIIELVKKVSIALLCVVSAVHVLYAVCFVCARASTHVRVSVWSAASHLTMPTY